jgi:hypothetical protein
VSNENAAALFDINKLLLETGEIARVDTCRKYKHPKIWHSCRNYIYAELPSPRPIEDRGGKKKKKETSRGVHNSRAVKNFPKNKKSSISFFAQMTLFVAKY